MYDNAKYDCECGNLEKVEGLKFQLRELQRDVQSPQNRLLELAQVLSLESVDPPSESQLTALVFLGQQLP